ncbi:MAG: hypothetical protein KDC80_03505 [Saprospiraceae bacterium]|nr:hypothetical protein [Saprospiraceae bacterium]
MKSNKPRLILTGGFLGAGKTTLLHESTKLLLEAGSSVALITNDQASGLVDTTRLLKNGVKVEELSGSCFCCDFNGFLEVINKLGMDNPPDYILAEPVGSCTDLSATIVQPLKDLYADKLSIAPLTVLADPAKLPAILDGGTAGLHPSAAYIFRKQLEEADVILITKTDLLETRELLDLKGEIHHRYPDAIVADVSAKMGKGISSWVEMIMDHHASGRKILRLDYDTYAEGEAVMGWLNTSLLLNGNRIDWNEFVRAFLDQLQRQLIDDEIAVGHIKLILENGPKYVMGNLTDAKEEHDLVGIAGVSDSAKMIINARVELPPESLDILVKRILEIVTKPAIEMEILTWNCINPGYPKPTHRYDRVI